MSFGTVGKRRSLANVLRIFSRTGPDYHGSIYLNTYLQQHCLEHEPVIFIRRGRGAGH